MKIEIEVLRAAINQLLDHAKEMRGETVEVDADLYWFIPAEALHDPEVEPAELTLGDLHDDWAAIAAIGTGAQTDLIPYHLVWASTLVRALGDHLIRPSNTRS